MVQRNLRKYPRRSARLKARVVLDWGSLDGTIENIGEGGILFVTDTLEGSVEIGYRAEACFTLDDEDEVRAPGEVLRVERYFEGGEILRSLAIRFDRPWRPTG